LNNPSHRSPQAHGRSRAFPGLWLDGAALFAENMVQVLAKLDEGLKTTEHLQFVEKVAKTRHIE
jgi:hypothetical protein